MIGYILPSSCCLSASVCLSVCLSFVQPRSNLSAWPCDSCSRVCSSRIGLHAHQQTHRWQAIRRFRRRSPYNNIFQIVITRTGHILVLVSMWTQPRSGVWLARCRRSYSYRLSGVCVSELSERPLTLTKSGQVTKRFRWGHAGQISQAQTVPGKP